jgi:hypothetical protein
MIELNYPVEKFPITAVLLSENNAIVTREAQIDVEAGSTFVKITGLTNQLNRASMHVLLLEIASDEISLQNPMVRAIVPERSETETEKDLKTELITQNNKIDALGVEIEKITKKREKLRLLMNKTTEIFPVRYSENKVKIEQYEELVVFLQQKGEEFYNAEITLKREKIQLTDERNKLKEKLRDLQSSRDESYNNLSFKLVNSSRTKPKLQIRYWVPSKWSPSYDLKITGDNAEILFWGIIENLSKEDWTNVNLELSYASFGDVSVARPDPMAMQQNIEGKLNEIFQLYGLGKTIERKQTTETLKPLSPTINVPADGETHAYLIQKVSSPIKLFHYWNAAETDYVVIGAELKNGPFDLLPGECNFFKEGEIIGRGKFPILIESNTIVRLALAVDSNIIATKRLIEQKYPKGKKMNLKYRLHLLTREKLAAEIEILDILPLTTHPRSKIRLLEVNPEPSIPTQGLMQWKVQLQDEWEATYEIEIQGVEVSTPKSE